ncbi:MAG TPA: hypothetical protein VGK19_23650 [Capsulimonadaceae bacterium]|jgi:hypothetical protein
MDITQRTNLARELAAIDVPRTSVAFRCDDDKISALMAKAEALAAANIVQFSPDMKALIEGGGYSSVYTETQPMGGEAYAKRDVRLGLNNQLLFMMCQRADGRLSGRVISLGQRDMSGWRTDPVYVYSDGDWESIGLLADFGQLQGNALPHPAFKMYFLAGKPAGYLDLLAETLEAFDDYLWRTRDPDGEGVLQSYCVWDTGEDNSARFGGSPNRWPHDYPPMGEHTPRQDDEGDKLKYYQWCSERELTEKIKMPFRSMDMMAYSYENRAVRALISDETGDGKADAWRAKADEVRQALRKHLWRPERGAAFDKDRNGEWMDTLIHNNLRCMYYGVFSQDMADEFIQRHLLNPDEFLTPVPLPSIAVNDPLFMNIPDNNWGGQVQGLTFQRLVRAMENYGRYAELTFIGRKILAALKAANLLTQQFDPFDAVNPAKDNKGREGYGPTVLAFMDYVARFYGIHIERDTVMWTGLTDAGSVEYTQVFGDETYTLRNDGSTITASVNDAPVFKCSCGVRVHTDMAGAVTATVGVDTVAHQVTLNMGDIVHKLTVEPNQIWAFSEDKAMLTSSKASLVA